MTFVTAERTDIAFSTSVSQKEGEEEEDENG